MARKPAGPLKRGWTTGACATAAARAAYGALLTGEFDDPIQITLPRGQQPSFALAQATLNEGWASAAVVKDAGDDPDVTHGALVRATVRPGTKGSGVVFRAGEGVGIVTKPGLPLAVGEPAINPAPREMMRTAIAELAARHRVAGDVDIEIAVPGGEAIALKTWNPRLGIVGGLSILGTTGIVVPYSCSAWIHSIHRGIDVARASGLERVAGCTGSTSEVAVRKLYGLPEIAMLDMGDFVGGLLKYLRRHPVRQLVIGGGFAKLCKLGAGHLDLHSSRSTVDYLWLSDRVREAGGDGELAALAAQANTANEVLIACLRAATPVADVVAFHARRTVADAVGEGVACEVVIVGRDGAVVGRSGGA